MGEFFFQMGDSKHWFIYLYASFYLVDLVDIESDMNYHDLRQWLKFNFNKPEEKKQT